MGSIAGSPLSELASPVRCPSSPRPSSPGLPPDLTGEEGEIRPKMGFLSPLSPARSGGGGEREGWESEGPPSPGRLGVPFVQRFWNKNLHRCTRAPGARLVERSEDGWQVRAEDGEQQSIPVQPQGEQRPGDPDQ